MRRPLIIVLMVALAAGVAPPSTRAACSGDCNLDGQVTVDELVLAVNLALGSAAGDPCEPVDANRDRVVTIDEIVSAVNAALGGCPAAPPRVIALSRDGQVASLDAAAPWTLRSAADLRATVTSARCRAGRCLVVHPSPSDSISVVDAQDLSLLDTIQLERGADPRDVALVDDSTVVIGQYGRASLLEIDLATQATTGIDLGALADADGLPETLKLASCGRRVFAQLRRVDHDTGVPAEIGAALAVIDLDRDLHERVVDADPSLPGVQGVALARRPEFDMPVDCAGDKLYVVEPAPLMQGGGRYEQVDLEALTAQALPLDIGAELGGFEVVGPDQYWIITHTEFGPGPSSHLNLIGGSVPDTHNTFAREHVNDLAFDRDAGLLYYPDPCFVAPSNPSCDTGLHIFHAFSGARATPQAIAVGFEPIEVVVSR